MSPLLLPYVPFLLLINVLVSCTDYYDSPVGSLLEELLKHVHVLSCFSCVQLLVTPWTVAHQAPHSCDFPRQEYW